MESKKVMAIWLLSLAALIIAIVMAAVGFPRLLQSQIHKRLELSNGTDAFAAFQKLPMPLQFQVYLFNVTNPDEVTDGEKPILQEIGPYVYDEYREKDITEFGDNDTVTFTTRKTFVFNQNKSGNLTEDDEITVLNFSFMVLMLHVYELMPTMAAFAYEAAPHLFPGLRDAFLRAPVGDLLFRGIFMDCSAENTTLQFVCGQMRQRNPPTLRPADPPENGFYFSMFAHLNNTPDGPYIVKRGREDLKDLGRVVSYKGRTSIAAWNDEYCGRINGTDTTIFPPLPDDVPEKVYIFQGDICRSMFAELQGKTTQFDLPAYKYEATVNALISKSAQPSNKCFCKKNWSHSHDGCLMNGVMSLSSCQQVPVVASFPHFYLASEELLDYIGGGIQPDKEKHSTFVSIEPKSGTALKGAKRLQFNIELVQMEKIPPLENVPNGLFPILWVEESAEVTEEIIQKLRTLYTAARYIEIVRWLLLIGTLVLFAFTTFLLVKYRFNVGFGGTNSVSFVMDQHGNGRGAKNLAFVEDNGKK